MLGHRGEHLLADLVVDPQRLEVASFLRRSADVAHQHTHARRHDFAGQENVAQRLERRVRMLGQVPVDGRICFEHVRLPGSRDTLSEIGNADGIDDLRAKLLQLGNGPVEDLPDFAIVVGRGIGLQIDRLADDADARAFQAVVCEERRVGLRDLSDSLCRDRVFRVIARDRIQQDRRIPDGARNRPSVSVVGLAGIMPCRLTSGTVGLSPTRLCTAAGPRIDPPVSSAIATVTKLVATPEPLPLDDPLALRLGSYAFRICPPADAVLKYPAAYSPIVDFPTMTAPARRSFSTTVASRFGTKSLNRIDPYVVGMSLVSTWSLTSTGMQWSGPVGPDAAERRIETIGFLTSARINVWTAFSARPSLVVQPRCGAGTPRRALGTSADWRQRPHECRR